MTVSKRLTQKVGPAPLWAWLIVGLAGSYLLYRRIRSSGSSSVTLSSTPAAATTGVAGDTGATGAASGSPLDQSGGDLLSSLLDNGNAYQQLLSALQGGIGAGSGGAVGGVPASSASSGSDTSGVTAATLDSGVNNAPTDPYAAAVASAQSTTPDYGLIAQEVPLSGADQGFALENALLSNPATDYSALTSALGIPTIGDIQAQLDTYANSIPSPATTTPVASPTPTQVSPAPAVAPTVYQPGTIVPKGTTQVT